MKIKLHILIASIFIMHINLLSQDIQKWYADDIYYNPSEKEISYIEIEFFSNEDFPNEDQYDEDYQNADNESQNSYSMRINRFHRDYFGSDLSFNYGYFHNPYMFNGFNSWMYGIDPFFYGGNMWSYNNWYPPFGGYNMYNPWYASSFINPYGFGMGYGYGIGFDMGINSFYNNQNTYYGPRNIISGNSNGISNVVTDPKIMSRNELKRNFKIGQKRSLFKVIKDNETSNPLRNYNKSNLVPSRSDYSNKEYNSSKSSPSNKTNKSSVRKNTKTRSNRNFNSQRSSNSGRSGGSGRLGKSSGRPR